MTTVNFFPEPPLTPIFIAAALAATATQRNASWSAGALGLIVFTSIIYQLTGFMIWTTRNTTSIILIVVIAASLLINFLTASREATSMAMAVLAVAVMFTPLYYLSVALIVAAAATGNEKRMWPMSITYVVTLTPLLILENGLTETSANNGPLIFTQLTNLAKNIRPPLTSLNVFLPDATAENFRDTTTLPVISYLTGTQILQLLIPLATLALIFSLTVTTAGITKKTLKQLAVIDESKLLQNLTLPIVSIITPLTFTTLLYSLSPRHLAGYQTTLQAAETLYMILCSLALGTAYAAKEQATTRLEKKEIARNTLKTKLNTLRRIIEENQTLITQTRQKTRPIDLKIEQKTAEETTSMITDIENGIQHADQHTVNRWTTQVEETTHRLNHTPENIRLVIITELNKLTNYAKTYGEALKETGIKGAFKWTNEVKGDTPLQQAITQYTRLTRDLKADTQKLYTEYKEAHRAYNTLTSRPIEPPTIDPATLLEADEVEAALKLVAEEYWLRYHNGSKIELERSTTQLLEATQRLSKQHRINDLEEITNTLQNPRPNNTPQILKTTLKLKTIIHAATTSIEEDDDKLRENLRSISPLAEELFTTQKLLPKNTIEKLSERNSELTPTINDTAKLLDETTTALKTHQEERRRSEENLIIAAHYLDAKNTISERLGEAHAVSLHELPYATEAARIYVKLYTHDDSTIEYDEEKDEVRRRGTPQ